MLVEPALLNGPESGKLRAGCPEVPRSRAALSYYTYYTERVPASFFEIGDDKHVAEFVDTFHVIPVSVAVSHI